METLYKGLLKHYSIKLSDNLTAGDRDTVYNKIFNTLADYVENILPIKMQEDGEKYKGGQPARRRHASYPYHRADGWLTESRGRCGYREDPRMYLILRRVQRSHKYG